MLTYQNRDNGNIKRYALGDFLHMGLLWACLHDDCVTCTYDPCDDENINRAVRLIFTGESLTEYTQESIPGDYESWMTILNIYTQGTDDVSSEDDDDQERYADV